MLFLIASIVLVILGIGWWFRHQPSVHVPCMSLAFAMDLGLLLYVEFTRHAVEKLGASFTQPTHHGLLYFHVLVSVLMLTFYVLQMLSGLKLLGAQSRNPAFHRYCGYAFAVCRLSNYITSFWVTGI